MAFYQKTTAFYMNFCLKNSILNHNHSFFVFLQYGKQKNGKDKQTYTKGFV